MGRKRLPPDERKTMMSIRIKQKYIDEIKQIPGYMGIIENLIADYLKKTRKDGDS